MASTNASPAADWRSDLPAAIVVFFVALPLCLGIALASGAPPLSGLIAGIIGGIVVGALSGSSIGVSGPAAGLAAIVATAIGEFGFQDFLAAVVLGGVIQIGFGILRAGVIGYYFPSSVIKGMLTGIGLIIILKQIPHFLGYDADFEGDQSFLQLDGENTFSELVNAVFNPSLGPTLIAVAALAILIFWDNVLAKKAKIFTVIQGPIVAVVIGVVYYLATRGDATLGIATTHLVDIPVPESFDGFIGQFSLPNFGALSNPGIILTAFTIALVASLETLLCVEATDKLDPAQHVTPTNRELLAQGTGNILSGLIGGLPITQVIVRSSANIQSGGKSKVSAIVHGILLLAAVVAIPVLLNLIPLSVLAAILLVVGYKLAKPSTVAAIYRSGWKQFVPYIVTVVAIVFTDLLTGIGLGLAVGIIIILYKNYQNSHFLHREESTDVDGSPKFRMTLAEEVTFFNKAAILRELDELPEDSNLELDVTKTRYLDYDIIEILENFVGKARDRNIDITIISQKGTVTNPPSYIEYFNLSPVADGH
ncbi:MAG: SulP family inorganic anion transporter [Saprospiraceae bacterium]